MKKWLFVGLSALILAACGSGADSPDPALPLDVTLAIEPKSPAVDETVTFSVTVRQGEELVTDANDVQFELWLSGSDDHEFVEAAHQGDGLYSIQKSFAQPGDYFVMYHVTARDFHSMTKTAFTVGDGKDGK